MDMFVSICIQTLHRHDDCRLDYVLAVFSWHILLLAKYSSSVYPDHPSTKTYTSFYRAAQFTRGKL